MRSSSGAHYIALDHVRGLAAFMVFAWHFTHAWYGYPIPFEYIPAIFPFALLDEWCKTCGGHVFTDHPTMGLVDVYAAVIPDFDFRPALHVHYGETRLRIKDGLPKMKDVPKEFHGSGGVLPE